MFAFLTCVSKFSQAGLFSGLNNLRDITLDPRFGAICGYTDAELDAVFAPELEGLDREKVRRWYNGYNWRGPERVYNPFDILLLFETREFEAHWFRTGTPTFLADLLSRRRFAPPALEDLAADDALLSAVDRIPVEALLFQTGYLTIVDEERDEDTRLYRLDYPNQEVKRSLNALLLKAMAPEVTVAAESRELRRLGERLRGPRESVPGVPGEQRVVREHGHGRGALRERVLFALRGGGHGRPRRGEHGAGQAGRRGQASERTRKQAGREGHATKASGHGCATSKSNCRRSARPP